MIAGYIRELANGKMAFYVLKVKQQAYETLGRYFSAQRGVETPHVAFWVMSVELRSVFLVVVIKMV